MKTVPTLLLLLLFTHLPASGQTPVRSADMGDHRIAAVKPVYEIRISKTGEMVATYRYYGLIPSLFPEEDPIERLEKPITTDGLIGRIKDMVASGETNSVSIVAAEGTPRSDVLRVVSLCLNLGVSRLSIATNQKLTEQVVEPDAGHAPR